MADLTLSQRFGTNAFIEIVNGKTFLTMELNDLQDQAEGGNFTNGLGLNISGITDSNGDEYASKIFWALLQLSKQNQPANNTDETVGIYITNSGKQNVTRNGTAQIGFRELITGYKDDSDGLTLDPDAIGAQSTDLPPDGNI